LTPSLILLAFFFPLAVYLLFLGRVNRRRQPLLVPGSWDFAGVLLAASGFLLFSGPGALSVLNDGWRDFLVFGRDPGNSSSTESLWQWWLLLTSVYFLFLVGTAAFFLWQARKRTSIYNIDRDTLQEALGRVCQQHGLQPLRAGELLYFSAAKRAGLPALALQSVILEVEPFPLMWHVTLHWEPAHSTLRQEIERALERELQELPTPGHALGGWLTLSGCALFLLMLAIGFGVLVYRILHHIN